MLSTQLATGPKLLSFDGLGTTCMAEGSGQERLQGNGVERALRVPRGGTHQGNT